MKPDAGANARNGVSGGTRTHYPQFRNHWVDTFIKLYTTKQVLTIQYVMIKASITQNT